MKTIQNRLEAIEKTIFGMMDGDANSSLKIERWKFGIGSKDSITLQEWDFYKRRMLEMSENINKTKVELNELEIKIRQNDGFMELIFYSNDGRVLGHIY